MGVCNPYDENSDRVSYVFWDELNKAYERANMAHLSWVGKSTQVLARFTCELGLRRVGGQNEATRIILAELVSGIERLAALRGELNRFHVEEEETP